MKFKREDGKFDIERFKAAVRIYITAQEILVDNACYPTKEIAENSHIFRTLGLGFANLGSLCMSYGLPYDSDEGRALAGAITAIMTGHAYEQSAELAGAMDAFKGYRDARCSGVAKTVKKDNVESMLNVIKLHREAVEEIQPSAEFNYLKTEARQCWDRALARGKQVGYRNAQVTVLAPTGTIAFLMDCDTTGVEPDIALVKYKLLAGGGMLKIVNRTVPEGAPSPRLQRQGNRSHHRARREVRHHRRRRGKRHDHPQRRQSRASARVRLRVQAFRGKRSIGYLAHLKMMAAAQPFISGAISKTVNMPNDCDRRGNPQHLRRSLEDGPQVRGHLSRRLEALPAAQHEEDQRSRRQDRRSRGRHRTTLRSKRASRNSNPKWIACKSNPASRLRRRLPDTRTALTHKFDIAGHEGYLTVGLFEDGQPGELFITMAKEGSTIGGLMDGIGTLTSMAFQYGVPLEALVRKFAHQRFEPSGFTKNPEIRNAASITDYVFRWMAMQFIPSYRETNTQTRNQPELAIPGLIEELKKKINRPVPELPISEDNDVLDLDAAAAIGKGQYPASSSRKVKSLSDSVAHFQQDAPTCPNCGHMAVRNGACYKCLNCGESLGCS
jgi:ribonucleoside-diphosphate reductase alpha chain